jgi:hypothetical protein
MRDEFEGIWKEAVVAESRYYPSRSSNRVPPEYECRVTASLTRRVFHFYVYVQFASRSAQRRYQILK